MKKIPFSKFGIMSVNYQLYSLEYALDSIANAGFRYVDFWGGAPHYSYFDTEPGKKQERISSIRKMMDDRDLKVSVFTAEQICLYPINVASSNPYVRKNSIEITKGYIEDTAALGAVHFFPQMGYCMFDEDKEAALERSIEALHIMADTARKNNVSMVMEQLQEYESNLCFNADTLKYLIDAVDSPQLNVCVDCVAAAAGNETLDDYYEKFGNKIQHVHLADGNPEGHMVPGEGENPINSYLQTLCENEFDGLVTMELNNPMYFADPDKATRDTAEWLKNCEWVEADK